MTQKAYRGVILPSYHGILALSGRDLALSLAFKVVSLKTQSYIDSLESLEIKGQGLFSLGDYHQHRENLKKQEGL